ncbi:MAG TPA: Fe-S cluster assembly protein SufD [Hyphomicrobiaceae bacterium]|nr:Fe-S cluster assembly protein SufD [Hyphomicrobiaceae bacterium]
MTTTEKTMAEMALAAEFDRIIDRLPGEGLRDERRAAMARLAASGLPHRRIEEWKYTDLRAGLKEVFAAADGANGVTAADVAAALGPLGTLEAHRLVFVDGIYAPALSPLDALGTDAIAVKVAAASQTFVPTAKPISEGARGDALQALNEAFASDGAIISVQDDASTSARDAKVRSGSPAKPIMIVSLSTARAPLRVTTRHRIEIDAGMTATVIEVYGRIGSSAIQTSAGSIVRIGKGAKLHHHKFALEGSRGAHLSSSDVEIGAGATYRAFHLTPGSGLARTNVFATFAGPDARLDISGAFLGAGADHVDTTLVIDHAVPGCESRELFKGILAGDAKGVFQGKVIVRPDAQKTDGKQMAQALMLSPTAEFDSKPELEIYADDVICGHGSTTAELDAELMFYCRSRGIPEAEARTLLIDSFIGEALAKVEDGELREACLEIVAGWLKTNL